MGKNVKISEEDMTTLSEEFTTCRDKAAVMYRSFTSMKGCLVNEVYYGAATIALTSLLDNMIETSVELFCVYEALRMYVESVAENFQNLDSEAGNDVENNVVNSQ